MKMLVLIEVDVSKTMSETMQRNGLELALDGTSLQVKIPNAPPVTQRKTKVVFIPNPKCGIHELVKQLNEPAIETAPSSESK